MPYIGESSQGVESFLSPLSFSRQLSCLEGNFFLDDRTLGVFIANGNESCSKPFMPGGWRGGRWQATPASLPVTPAQSSIAP